MPQALQKIKTVKWLSNALLVCVFALALLSFFLFPLADRSSQTNIRQVYDSSRWHALQLQLQTYRLMNYLAGLKESDFPLKGNATFQYDLVLSRIDLMRKGEIGSHVRIFTNGKATRLLNIISGELELISLNIVNLEKGDHSQIPVLIERLQNLDMQITDLVVLVNQGANELIANNRIEFEKQLGYIEFISLALLVFSGLLLYLAFKISYSLRVALTRNERLEQRVELIKQSKTDVISRITAELKPRMTDIFSASSALSQTVTTTHVAQELDHLSGLSRQLITQLESYYDLTLIETGQLTPIYSEGSLKVHFEYLMQSLAPSLAQHHIRSLCHIDPRLHDQVEMDFKRLHEVLVILISELMPYCSDGDMSVRIRPSSHPLAVQELRPGKTPRMIQISIRDTGQALPDSVQKGLRSNPYDPAISSFNQAIMMGVGFAFSHYLIAALGGELHFSATPGLGNEIWIDLPIWQQDGLEPESHPLDRTPAVFLSGDTIFDKSLAQLLQSAYANIRVMTDISTFELETLAQKCSLLFVSDTPLNDEWVEHLNRLADTGVNIILTEPVKQQWPSINEAHQLHFPITQMQLDALADT